MGRHRWALNILRNDLGSTKVRTLSPERIEKALTDRAAGRVLTIVAQQDPWHAVAGPEVGRPSRSRRPKRRRLFLV